MPTDLPLRRPIGEGAAASAALPTALLAAFAFAAPLQAAAAPAPRLVERVLAVVDGRPLLLSDTRALAGVRGVGEEEALRLLVDESLMFDQASRTPQAAVTLAEETAARDELFAKAPLLFDAVSEAALRRLLHRQLAILKYVEFRFRPQARPSDEDLQGAYTEIYQGREAAPSFETVAEALRERLTREKLSERVEAWVRELRKDADLREVGPPQATQ